MQQLTALVAGAFLISTSYAAQPVMTLGQWQQLMRQDPSGSDPGGAYYSGVRDVLVDMSELCPPSDGHAETHGVAEVLNTLTSDTKHSQGPAARYIAYVLRAQPGWKCPSEVSENGATHSQPTQAPASPSAEPSTASKISAIENKAYDAQLPELARRHPQLDAKSPDFKQSVVNQMEARVQAHINEGYRPVEALRAAEADVFEGNEKVP